MEHPISQSASSLPLQNVLEETLSEARAGKVAEDAFLRLFLKTPILIPSRKSKRMAQDWPQWF